MDERVSAAREPMIFFTSIYLLFVCLHVCAARTFVWISEDNVRESVPSFRQYESQGCYLPHQTRQLAIRVEPSESHLRSGLIRSCFFPLKTASLRSLKGIFAKVWASCLYTYEPYHSNLSSAHCEGNSIFRKHKSFVVPGICTFIFLTYNAIYSGCFKTFHFHGADDEKRSCSQNGLYPVLSRCFSPIMKWSHSFLYIVFLCLCHMKPLGCLQPALNT